MISAFAFDGRVEPGPTMQLKGGAGQTVPNATLRESVVPLVGGVGRTVTTPHARFSCASKLIAESL